MQLSHTRPTKTDTSAHSKSLTHLYTSRVKRELVMPATMQPLYCMLRDLKIYPSSTESETSLEFTEPLLDSTMDKDNSTQTFSITAHGLYSQLTRSQPSKKSEVKMLEATLLPSLSQVNTTPLKKPRLHLFKTSENGLNNTSLNTM